ncbi:MAG: NTP transferase domain-containing protein [Actinomycetota bacterium]
MAKIRGAILAAGRGVRMGGARPKTLLPVAENESLLFYLLKGLKKSGVDDLIVVTGYGPGEIGEYVAEHWGEENLQLVFNARYASFGNFHSVRMALDQSPGVDLLVVNSDIVVPPDVFTRVLDTAGDLVIAVERRYGLDEEDMRVRVDGTRARSISKKLKLAHSHGEFCGVSLLRPAAAAHYADVASDVEWSGETSLYYEDVYDRILGRLDARAAEVKAGEYAEVDEPSDIDRAAAVIDRHRSVWE